MLTEVTWMLGQHYWVVDEPLVDVGVSIRVGSLLGPTAFDAHQVRTIGNRMSGSEALTRPSPGKCGVGFHETRARVFGIVGTDLFDLHETLG